MIFNNSGYWKGFAIEFKNPRRGYGELSESQHNYLNKLFIDAEWKILVTQLY